MIVAICSLSLAFVVSAIPQNPQEMLELAEEVEKEANREELTILRTLLEKRSSWHPSAGRHLQTVMRRIDEKRRLSTPRCNELTTEAACTGHIGHDLGDQCVSCRWTAYGANRVDGYCRYTECEDYTNQSSCCENANKIPTGCYWAHAANYSKCRKMTCEAAPHNICPGFSDTCTSAQTVCSTMTNCKYTCAGCHDDHMTCTCDGSMSSCSSGDGAVGALFSLLNCPLFDCTMCMKGSTIEEAIKKRTTDCATRCASSLHCDAEARCLLEGAATGSGTCPTTLPAPHPSCGTVAFTTTTTTEAHYNSCASMCITFESNCNTSCGAPAACSVDTSIGRRQTMIALSAMFGTMASLGMIGEI